MAEKTFVLLRRWCQRGTGDLSRFSAAELRMMRLGGWIWGRCGSGGVGQGQPTCCPRRSGSLVSRACLLGLVAGRKDVRKGKSVESTGDGNRGAGKVATGVLLQSWG